MGKKSNAKQVKKEEPEKEVAESLGKTKASEASQKSQTLQIREIVIQTNGNDINIVKNETVGNLELLAILQVLIGNLNSSK